MVDSLRWAHRPSIHNIHYLDGSSSKGIVVVIVMEWA